MGPACRNAELARGNFLTGRVPGVRGPLPMPRDRLSDGPCEAELDHDVFVAPSVVKTAPQHFSSDSRFSGHGGPRSLLSRVRRPSIQLRVGLIPLSVERLYARLLPNGHVRKSFPSARHACCIVAGDVVGWCHRPLHHFCLTAAAAGWTSPSEVGFRDEPVCGHKRSAPRGSRP